MRYMFNATVWCRMFDSGDPEQVAIAKRADTGVNTCQWCGLVWYGREMAECGPCTTAARESGRLVLPGTRHSSVSYIHKQVHRLRRVHDGVTTYRAGIFSCRARGFGLWEQVPTFRRRPAVAADKLRAMRAA